MRRSAVKHHELLEMDKQKRRILVVHGHDRFYLRLPGYLPAIVDVLKATVPYERRLPKDGLGWVMESQCWALGYEDYDDVMAMLQQMVPRLAAEVVDELPPVDRSKSYELEA